MDGEPLGEWSAWGGQGENTPLLYGDFPTIQPDNTSGKQLCTYFYVSHHSTAQPHDNLSNTPPSPPLCLPPVCLCLPLPAAEFGRVWRVAQWRMGR